MEILTVLVAGVPGIVAIASVVYAYGKLTSRVDYNNSEIDEVKGILTDELREARQFRGDMRERMAKIEGRLNGK